MNDGGAKGFAKIEPTNSGRRQQVINNNETQSADQAEGGNEELFNTGRLLSSAQDLIDQKAGGMSTPPAKGVIKIAGNNRNHQGQLKLEGDLTQINEQVANERQEESSLRGRLKMNTASDENLNSQR